MLLICYGYGQKVCQCPPVLCSACRKWGLFGLGLLCSVLVIGLFPRTGRAEGHGRIRGIIQRAGQGVADQRIMLIRFGPNQDVQRTPGQTDTAGRFLFESLETGSAFTYFVGIRYQEQLHRSDPIKLQSDEPVEIVLELGESTAQESANMAAQLKLHITNHILVIVGRGTRLEVREVVRIVNPGPTPYIDKGVAFRLPLPLGYYDLGPVQGLTAEYVRVDAAGLSYGSPLAPGEHQIIYTYNLPWHDDLATILVERTLDTSVLDVLVDDARFVTTSDLPFGGRVTIEPHSFAHFRGVNLEAQSRSWLQVMPHQTSVSFLSLGAYSLIIGIMLLGLIIPLQNLRSSRLRQEQRRTGSPKHEHIKVQELSMIGRKLLQSIAHLDDQHVHGMIGEVVHQQRRQAYKEQLFSLAEQFQSVRESQEAIGERRGEA
jgi:hypothetical protein